MRKRGLTKRGKYEINERRVWESKKEMTKNEAKQKTNHFYPIFPCRQTLTASTRLPALPCDNKLESFPNSEGTVSDTGLCL